jgi:hypothetical protein
LRRPFEPKRVEIIGTGKKLHNENVHNFHFSPNIIKPIKQIRMSWAVHVARMGDVRNSYNFYLEKLKGRYHLGDPCSGTGKWH